MWGAVGVEMSWNMVWMIVMDERASFLEVSGSIWAQRVGIAGERASDRICRCLSVAPQKAGGICGGRGLFYGHLVRRTVFRHKVMRTFHHRRVNVGIASTLGRRQRECSGDAQKDCGS